MTTINAVLLVSSVFLASKTVKSLGQTPIPIISESSNLGENGHYNFQYETANGISVQEVGSRKYARTNNEAELVQGGFAYTSPDGTPIATSYIADENGFQAAGSHLPVGPPIPPLIQRALEWIAANSEPRKEQPRF